MRSHQESVQAKPKGVHNKNEFVVRSRLYQKRSVVKTLLLLTAVLTALIVLDSGFRHWRWWLVGSFLLVLIVIETGPRKEQVEVVVTIHPLLGIVQLATWNNDRLQGGPPRVVPLELIQDVIVQEYVGAFKVTSHVVFRLGEKGGMQQNGSTTTDPTTTTRLEHAFPGMELSFAQCLAMKNHIQTALHLARTTATTSTHRNHQPNT